MLQVTNSPSDGARFPYVRSVSVGDQQPLSSTGADSERSEQQQRWAEGKFVCLVLIAKGFLIDEFGNQPENRRRTLRPRPHYHLDNNRVQPHGFRLWRPIMTQKLQLSILHALSLRSRVQLEDSPVKREFLFQSRLDVLSFPPPVSFIREDHIFDVTVVFLNSLHNCLCLLRWNDCIYTPLFNLAKNSVRTLVVFDRDMQHAPTVGTLSCPHYREESVLCTPQEPPLRIHPIV